MRSDTAPAGDGYARDILTEPVRGPGAWTAAELAADPAWIHALAPADVAEIEQALSAVTKRGRRACGFAREDFALPSLAPRLAAIAHDLEHGRGCALLRGLDPGRYTVEEREALYWGIGTHLGEAISQNARGERLARVRDTGRDYMSANVRGYTTRAALAAHCDSADVVGLLCEHPARTGGESLIASSLAVYNRILAEHPEYLAPLYEGFHFDLRAEGATGDPDEVTRARVPVFIHHLGFLSCRYNRKTIEDGMRKIGRPLEGLALEAVRAVGEIAMSPPCRFDMRFEPGDIQLLNNHTVLHARAAFEDHPEPARRRSLIRLWLNLRDGRPLAPRFADRMNTGPRGGVAVRGRDYA